MGNIINSALAPVGIKPFAGGPYRDGGNGDIAEAKDTAAQENYKFLGDYGRSLLGNTPGAGGRTPSGPNALDQFNTANSNYTAAANGGLGPVEGEAAKISPLLEQFKTMNGLNDPNGDPNALTGSDLHQFNQEQGALTHARSAAEAHLKQALASRGITSGQAYESAVQGLHDHWDSQQAEHSTAYHQNIKANKNNALQSLVANYGQLGTQQEGQHANKLNALQGVIGNAGQKISMGTGLVGTQATGQMGSANLYQGLGQQASANNSAAWNAAANFVGGAAGAAFGLPKAPVAPVTPAAPTSNPWSLNGVNPWGR